MAQKKTTRKRGRPQKPPKDSVFYALERATKIRPIYEFVQSKLTTVTPAEAREAAEQRFGEDADTIGKWCREYEQLSQTLAGKLVIPPLEVPEVVAADSRARIAVAKLIKKHLEENEAKRLHEAGYDLKRCAEVLEEAAQIRLFLKRKRR